MHNLHGLPVFVNNLAARVPQRANEFCPVRGDDEQQACIRGSPPHLRSATASKSSFGRFAHAALISTFGVDVTFTVPLLTVAILSA